jgi:uncharacterized lipoprotein YajG
MTCGTHLAADVSKSLMKKILLSLAPILLLGALIGCSKSDQTAEETAPPAAATPADPVAVAQPSQSANAAINSLPQVNQAVQNRQYENAVQTLNQIQPLTLQMSDQQRLQYQQARQDAAKALIQAMGTDPAAKAAYEKLSRAATGR